MAGPINQIGTLGQESPVKGGYNCKSHKETSKRNPAEALNNQRFYDIDSDQEVLPIFGHQYSDNKSNKDNKNGSDAWSLGNKIIRAKTHHI